MCICETFPDIAYINDLLVVLCSFILYVRLTLFIIVQVADERHKDHIGRLNQIIQDLQQTLVDKEHEWTMNREAVQPKELQALQKRNPLCPAALESSSKASTIQVSLFCVMIFHLNGNCFIIAIFHIYNLYLTNIFYLACKEPFSLN